MRPRPLISQFLLALALSIVIRLFPVPQQRPDARSPFKCGDTVAIQSARTGRYVEVAANNWVYASSYTPTKPAATFEVHCPGAQLVQTLLATREFRESSNRVQST